MSATRVVPPHRNRERGQVLAFFGIMMLALTGFVVVGVDVARLAFTAAETQSLADVAATAAVLARSKGEADPVARARTVIQQNYADGRGATYGTAATDMVRSIEPGRWDFATSTFTRTTWTDPTTNAARADATVQVANLVAAAIGVTKSDVRRQAIAAVDGACSEVIPLPIAIEQDAIQQFLDSADCRSIPVTRIFQVPFDNSCFTSLSASQSASADAVRDILPQKCCPQCEGDSVTLSVNDQIQLSNGQIASALAAIAGCLAPPRLDEFIVPIIPADSCCGGCTRTVKGFARIIIDHVVSTGSASEKGVYIKGICREDVSGTNPGCSTAGENAVAIVR